VRSILVVAFFLLLIFSLPALPPLPLPAFAASCVHNFFTYRTDISATSAAYLPLLCHIPFALYSLYTRFERACRLGYATRLPRSTSIAYSGLVFAFRDFGSLLQHIQSIYNLSTAPFLSPLVHSDSLWTPPSHFAWGYTRSSMQDGLLSTYSVGRRPGMFGGCGVDDLDTLLVVCLCHPC
jgi:hypothetical protein